MLIPRSACTPYVTVTKAPKGKTARSEGLFGFTVSDGSVWAAWSHALKQITIAAGTQDRRGSSPHGRWEAKRKGWSGEGPGAIDTIFKGMLLGTYFQLITP